MHPKIHPRQSLSAGTVTGPIGDWEDDEAAVVFTFVISQVGTDGLAIGIGKSEVYKAPKDTHQQEDWGGTVTPVAGRLSTGGATVFAWASIAQKDGGWEMYPWGRPVNLS